MTRYHNTKCTYIISKYSSSVYILLDFISFASRPGDISACLFYNVAIYTECILWCQCHETSFVNPREMPRVELANGLYSYSRLFSHNETASFVMAEKSTVRNMIKKPFYDSNQMTHIGYLGPCIMEKIWRTLDACPSYGLWKRTLCRAI